MYAVTRLDLATLDPQQREAFATLTESKYQCCLQSQNPYGISNTIQFAIAATYKGHPVGLVLSSLMSHLHYAELHSLFVKEDHRNHKIATQMLSLLAEELAKQACSFVSFVYPSAEPTTPFLEKLLHDLGWSTPSLFGIHCRFDENILSSPWLKKDFQLPPSFSIFPWHELTLEERQKLLRQYEQGVFSASVTPFGDEEKIIEKINSLGLRYNNEVVGWMVTHRIAEDTIRYSALFIQREFQYRKEAIILLSHAIKLQKQSSVRWGTMEINIAQIEPSYLSFVKKRYLPYAETVAYTKQSWLQLEK